MCVQNYEIRKHCLEIGFFFISKKMEGVMESDIFKFFKNTIILIWLFVVLLGYAILLKYIKPVKEPEGSVLLINFYEHKLKTKTTETRTKSEKDVQAIKKFCRERNYILTEKPCINKKDVIAAIKKYGENPQRALESCSMIFLGSHGNEGYIVDKKWNKIPLQDVVNEISKSPYLRKQYTILVIQACRGEKELTKKNFTDETHELKKPRTSKNPVVIPQTLPKLYILNSTQPGTKSKQGYFVPRFFKLLSKYSFKKDVLSIFDDVLYEMPRTVLHGEQIQVAEMQCKNKETFFLCPKAVEVATLQEELQKLANALLQLPFVILKQAAVIY